MHYIDNIEWFGGNIEKQTTILILADYITPFIVETKWQHVH
tara:strand:- start:2255 stop:2377 length:123 start_codon:yes stop_codon:yes gene_type:complete